MVTPTYYVYFTSTTIITSSVLFQGFRGTASQIVTVVMGFLTICAGVVLLQLSKSAKDVPDTAIFTGDLDQIHMIADQEQSETEPKADAIRGTAAILRRFSNARQKMEEEEFRRLHEEKERERLAPLSEDGQEVYEWDGLRRRRTTTMGSQRSRVLTTASSAVPPSQPWSHPPLGMSRFPDMEDLESERDNASSPGFLSSIAGTIRSRTRSVLPGHPDYNPHGSIDGKIADSSHPVQLSEIAVPPQKYRRDGSYSRSREHVFGLPAGLEKTEYGGAASVISDGSSGRHVQIADPPPPMSSGSLAPPTPPPHGDPSMARRQFSFQNVFRRHQPAGTSTMQAQQQQDDHHPILPLFEPPQPSTRHGGLRNRGYSDREVPRDSATEEERLGLVKGDSQSMPALPRYDTDSDEESVTQLTEDSEESAENKHVHFMGGRELTDSSPPHPHRGRRGRDDDDDEPGPAVYGAGRSRGWNDVLPPGNGSPHSRGGGGSGAYA